MEITIKTLIELFLTTKSTEGRSVRTISWYREKLYPFERHLSVGREATLLDLTLESARDFVASLQQQDQRFVDHPYREPVDGGLSDYTIHGYVRAIRAFSAWLVQEEFLSTDPLTKLKRPKVSEPMIEVLSDQEIADVIDAINHNSFNDARMYAIVLVLLDTGIRASECCDDREYPPRGGLCQGDRQGQQRTHRTLRSNDQEGSPQVHRHLEARAGTPNHWQPVPHTLWCSHELQRVAPISETAGGKRWCPPYQSPSISAYVRRALSHERRRRDDA
jgi:hypothetical protein